MIGRELWDFIADEKGYCIKLIDLIDKIARSVHFKFSEELERKRKLLIEEISVIKQVYKDSLKEKRQITDRLNEQEQSLRSAKDVIAAKENAVKKARKK